jgi:hypothetical protein
LKGWLKLILRVIEKVKIIIGFVLLAGRVLAQGADDLTAEKIVDRSIEFCGGEGRIGGVKTASVNYMLVQPDESTAVICEKVRSGQKYVQSVLSKTHVPQTTFFDGTTLTRVNGSSLTRITEIEKTEEVRLKLYKQVQYGYKAFGYKLTRLPDKKFQNFDCYVVDASAPGGYTTTNFFDKTNYRLLMIVYPNGNKSLMIEYVLKDSVLFNSRIVNTFPGSDQSQELILQDVTLNTDIPDIWFNCPYKTDVILPAHIRTGAFESTTNVKTMFTRDEKSQQYYDEDGKLVSRGALKWANNDTFGLIDEKLIQNGEASSESGVLVRILSWDDAGYVCHWIAGNYFDTDHYKISRR